MYPFFQSARQLAVETLGLSSRDLEHGLELHRNSLVVDTYAFAPRALVDHQVLQQAREQGAFPAELELLHHDALMAGVVHSAAERQFFAAAFAASGVDCLVQNAGEEANDIEILLRRLARYTYVVDNLPDVLRRSVRAADVVAAREQGKHCLYLTTNAVPLTRNLRYPEDGLSFIRTFAQLGVKMMHLTYNRANLMGDGCGEPRNGGLTDFGQAVVHEMNECGVVVDLAHCGIQTTIDAAGCSRAPVVVSHAVCRELSNHCRSKTDEALRAVAGSGGYTGICCLPTLLLGRGDIVTFLDHIDHAVKTVGAEHVSIGTDSIAIRDQGQLERMLQVNGRPQRLIMDSLWPREDSIFSPRWHQENMWKTLAWTNWPIFTAGLVQRGHSDEDIQKIIGGNALRVMSAVQNRHPT